MKQLNKSLIKGLATYSLIALPFLAPGTAAAALTAATPATLTVNATVVDKCTIAVSGPLTFATSYDAQGAHNLASATITGTTSLNTNCVKSASTLQYIILSAGSSGGTVGARQMHGLTGSNADKLLYSLKQPTSNAGDSAGNTCVAARAGVNWNDTTGFVLLPNSGGLTTRSYTVCGEIYGGQTSVQADGYTDSVIATIYY